jgi:hypothetical protein
MVTSLNIDNSIDDDNKYYITIQPSDLESDIFELNQYYKVQLRFVSQQASTLPDTPKIASWLSTNQDFFSEWSSVCLIKGISKPTFEIKGLTSDEDVNEIVFTNSVFDFVGRMYYQNDDNAEKETLKCFQFQMYDLDNPLVVYGDSGIVYTDSYSPNEINYTLEKELQDGASYKVICTYTTENNYTETLTYLFSVLLYSLDSMDITVTTEPDNENGRIKVNIKSNGGEQFLGNLTIRRTSSESNFTVWRDVYTKLATAENALNLDWYDITVENGVWYQYAVQRRNANGDRGIITKTEEPVMVYAEDIFLTNGSKQLKIKYDPTISSYKQTVTESKTDTLGSVYPFIRRNGNTNYKQFSISGLISHYSDEDSLMTTEEEMYGTSLNNYQNFNEKNFVKQKDFIREKKFRDKVIEFLYDGQPKLYKSLTEGNIIVKLMDISFTPNQTLGRMVYSFSCTAYEVAAATLDNYILYGIQDSGNLGVAAQYTAERMGQLYSTYFKQGQDIITSIKNVYKEKTSSDYSLSLNGLKYLKIEFESEPSLYEQNSAGNWQMVSTASNKSYYGYLINVNGSQILVDRDGVYEIYDDELLIYSISLGFYGTATVNYICDLQQKEVVTETPSKFYYYHINGQLWGRFKPKVLQLEVLTEKYKLNYEDYYQKFVSINTMKIEAQPGTIVYVKDSLDTSYNRFVVGISGVLEFGNETKTIDDFYFAGTHMMPNDDNLMEGLRGYYIEQDNPTYLNFDAIRNPKEMTAYWVANEDGLFERYLYKNGEYYYFSSATDDVNEPVDAVVSYYCDIMKGEY